MRWFVGSTSSVVSDSGPSCMWWYATKQIWNEIFFLDWKYENFNGQVTTTNFNLYTFLEMFTLNRKLKPEF